MSSVRGYRCIYVYGSDAARQDIAAKIAASWPGPSQQVPLPIQDNDTVLAQMMDSDICVVITGTIHPADAVAEHQLDPRLFDRVHVTIDADTAQRYRAKYRSWL